MTDVETTDDVERNVEVVNEERPVNKYECVNPFTFFCVMCWSMIFLSIALITSAILYILCNDEHECNILFYLVIILVVCVTLIRIIFIRINNNI